MKLLILFFNMIFWWSLLYCQSGWKCIFQDILSLSLYSLPISNFPFFNRQSVIHLFSVNMGKVSSFSFLFQSLFPIYLFMHKMEFRFKPQLQNSFQNLKQIQLTFQNNSNFCIVCGNQNNFQLKYKHLKDKFINLFTFVVL